MRRESGICGLGTFESLACATFAPGAFDAGADGMGPDAQLHGGGALHAREGTCREKESSERVRGFDSVTRF